jgi:predicted DNA-binding protein
MVQITVRLPEEIQELLKYESMRSGKSQNAVITDLLIDHLEPRRAALLRIKQAVVAGRVKGERSRKDSLDMAANAASLDDSEGLGEIKVKHTTKKS